VKALFVVNRRSGIRRNRDVSAIIRRTCTWDHDIVFVEAKDDLDGLVARASAEKFDVVYAVGGDGTIHEVAKRLIGTPLALGIIPTGSGNGFARHIGLPISVRRSLRACGQERITAIDTATVNGRPFVATMGIGFDAWVAEQFASSTVRGLRTYMAVIARGLSRYAAEEYDMEIDGQPLRPRAMLIAIANASQYGNNARIAPLASLQDGVLDVVIVEQRPLARLPIDAVRLFAGTLHRARGVIMRRGRHIEMRRPAPGPAHLDGEPVTLPATITVDVVPKSLRILLPDGRHAV
jgi:diacylglycerol kinase (ATP)